MRKITKPLNPSVTDWKKQTTDLRVRLNLAINYFSGLAQPPRSPDAKTAKANKKADMRTAKEIQDIVADIACAFGVTENTLGTPEAELAILAAKLPKEVVVKLLKFFLTHDGCWEDDAETALDIVRQAFDGGMLAGHITKAANVTRRAYDVNAHMIYETEEETLEQFLEGSWEITEEEPNPKVAKILQKWADIYAGKKSL
jgi:hypothetical protein